MHDLQHKTSFSCFKHRGLGLRDPQTWDCAASSLCTSMLAAHNGADSWQYRHAVRGRCLGPSQSALLHAEDLRFRGLRKAVRGMANERKIRGGPRRSFLRTMATETLMRVLLWTSVGDVGAQQGVPYCPCCLSTPSTWLTILASRCYYRGHTRGGVVSQGPWCVWCVCVLVQVVPHVPAM